MKKKYLIMLFIIGIFIVLTFIVGASYAYFSITRISVNTSIDNNTLDIAMDLNSTATIDFSVNPYIPFSSDLFAESSEVSLSTNLTNSDSAHLTCEYDIVYTPDLTSGTFVPSADNTGNLQELVIIGTDNSGQNSSFSFNLANKPYNGTDYKIMTATISANSGATVNQVWKLKVAYYNYNFEQSINAGKTIKGTVSLKAKECKKYKTALTIVNELIGSSNTDSNSSPWSVKNELGLRYQGKNPNNYMCFGSTCTSGYLYRIIGILDDEALDGDSTLYTDKNLRLIKSTYSSTSAYATSADGASGDWTTSTIRNVLNNTFYNTATGIANIRDIILTTKWYLMTNVSYAVTPAYMYERERNGVIRAGRAAYSFDKIGLIYGSDYFLSSYETGSCDHSLAYTTTVGGYCKDYSFLTPGSTSWAITPSYSNSNYARYYTAAGASSTKVVTTSYRYQPVFHLKSNIMLTGTGTSSDPYRIVE